MKHRKNELGLQLMKGQPPQLHNSVEFTLQLKVNLRPHKVFSGENVYVFQPTGFVKGLNLPHHHDQEPA